MNEEKLIQAFKQFAKDQVFFDGQIPVHPFLQLIAAIGFTENVKKPKTELMIALVDALDLKLDAVKIEELLEGDVY
jgi:Ca2+-binding EF-hand superfamily protein